MTDQGKMNLKVIFGLFLVHFTGDFYNSFISPLVPVLTDKLALTMTQVGLLTGISRILAFVVQPVVGYTADRYKNRVFILGGPLIALLATPLVGVAASFWMALACVAVGSLGSSMFHPTGAAIVTDNAGGRVTFAMSLYGVGGTIAFAVGPLFVTWYVTAFGLGKLPYTSIIGLIAVAVMVFIVPKPAGEGLAKLGFFGSLRDVMGPVWRPLAVLCLLAVLRTVVSQSFFTFGLIYFSKSGQSLMSIGAIVASFTTAGAISGVVCGHLADRYGFRIIFLISYLLATPCYWLFLKADPHWIYAAAFGAGFVVMATMPVGVAMAQTLAPKGKSMASSLMMGFAFGIGGMLTPIAGKLADIYGIIAVLKVIMWLPVASIPLILLLPGGKLDNR